MLVALVSDLFFGSKILELAARAGVQARVYDNPGEFVQALAADSADHVLVELRQVDDTVLEALPARAHVAGFGPHVERDRFRQARSGGIATLWANSALETRLGPWLTAPAE